MTLLFLKTITDYPIAYISGITIELIAWSPLILDIMHYNKSIWHLFAMGGSVTLLQTSYDALSCQSITFPSHSMAMAIVNAAWNRSQAL